MRVALVHDWLTGMRGGERVLERLVEAYPEAPIYTLVHVAGACSPAIEARPIHASWLSSVPGVARHYRKALPLFPRAMASLRAEPCDLLLSTHHAVAKALPRPEGAVHLCYCLTPMRYIWDQVEAYLGRGVRRRLARPVVSHLRRADLRSSGPDQVDRFVAISRSVAARIHLHYRRACRVVHPPVAVDEFAPDGRAPEDFYLLVGGFVPYKREAVAVEAFRELGRRLVIVGDGPGRAAIERRAPENVELRGRVDQAELARLYARCRALVYPQEEDFGIAAVEVQAAGRPVIAFARGGALDTVRDIDCHPEAPTGITYAEPDADGLARAVLRFEASETRFEPDAIRSWAERFAPDRFARELAHEVELAFERRRRDTR